jgi:hypothetical protein
VNTVRERRRLMLWVLFGTAMGVLVVAVVVAMFFFASAATTATTTLDRQSRQIDDLRSQVTTLQTEANERSVTSKAPGGARARHHLRGRANICCLPIRPQAAVRQRVIQALDLGGAVFFAEIEIPRYSRAVRVQSASAAPRVRPRTRGADQRAELVAGHQRRGGPGARWARQGLAVAGDDDRQGRRAGREGRVHRLPPGLQAAAGVSRTHGGGSRRWNTYKAALRRQIAILHARATRWSSAAT